MYVFVFAAAAAALYFGMAACQRPRLAEFLAAVLWAAYAVYEYFVANGTLCDANCNIRVDLAFFFPLLGYATYLALQKEPRTVSAAILSMICLALVAWLAYVFGNVVVSMVAGVGALLAGIYALKSLLTINRA